MGHEENTNPERFDPSTEGGRLIESEHRARYRWAARLVKGKAVLDCACGTGYGLEMYAAAGAAAVTGVDVDPEAVRVATSRYGKAATVLQGDVRKLPLDDDTFDLVTCFETIEHVAGAEEGIAELRRVLKPSGILVISSPNPDVYVGHNEHHVHEFRPAELAAAVGAHFAETAVYDQRAWLGSSITVDAGRAADELASTDVLRVEGEEDDGPIYSIVVAADKAPPALEDLVALGEPFEARWWEEQVENVRKDAMAAFDRSNDALSRLNETSAQLVDANQELAQIPLLRHKLATLEEQHAELSREYHSLLESTSWKLTKPLRRT
ncbi:MAG TPA: methyltransferase domain-containing protein [Solirubrobacterales bacterium]|jgi:SAM-dependent methyltransferase|nr:methyltransferase domain-containing protein [Solirubrobacterales bacterium]